MHGALVRVTMEATVHLLLAGLLLVAASLAGLGGSVPPLALFVALAAAGYLVRDRLRSVGTVAGRDVGGHLETAWVAPTLAATTTLLAWGATPGEIQSLGGLLGLAGMANYFVRPVYLSLYGFVSSATDGAGAGRRS